MASDNLLIEQAIEDYQQGNFSQAARICHNLVKDNPNDYEALHLLGIILHEAGLNDQASDVLKKAMTIGGPQVNILHNYGLVLRAKGEFGAAAAIFRGIVAKVPAQIDSWYNLGEIALHEDNFGDAIGAFEKVLKLDPDSFGTRINLGVALRKLGRPMEARNYLKDIIDLDPKNVAAQNNIGIAETELNNLPAARTAFQTALGVEPNYSDAHFNLGNVYWIEKKYEVAAECFGKVLELDQNNPAAQYHLALCMQKLKKYKQAFVLINELVKNCSEDIEQKAQFLGGRANVLRDLGKINEAVIDVEAAVLLSPRNPILLGNKALTLVHAGEIEEAIGTYKLAIIADPYDEGLQSHLAQALLLGGCFKEGWHEFESRLNSPETCAKQNAMPGVIWRGQSLARKHLLIWCEQGLGDIIQFLRFVPLMKAKAKQVTLLCSDRLRMLLNNFDSSITVSENVEFDAHVDFNLPLMSLPYLLGLETVFDPGPYLFADSKLITQWDEVLGRKDRPRIGIAWQGNPAYEADHQRSIPLSYLHHLISNNNYEFVSLQQGFGSEQLIDIPNPITVLDDVDKLAAFVDTAAIVANLDLVITSDTAIAHLVGALGMPVWLLLAKTPDWRWLLNKETSPWYSSMRVFRQTKAGRWEDVINEVTLALGQENFHL